MDKDKTHISIIIIGPVDSGKTTLAGHLLSKCGGNGEQFDDKFEKEITEARPGFLGGSWLRKHAASWDHHITINASVNKCQTTKYTVTLIDTPGRRDFTKKLIARIVQADCAVLVVPAGENELEAAISKYGQIHEHISLAYVFGVKQMIVAVNKMDAIEPGFVEARFDEIRTNVWSSLRKVGYQPQNIAFVPIMSRNGDNLINTSSRMPWFRGWTVERQGGHITGKTLLEAIDAIIPPSRPVDKPLRLPLQAVYKIGGVGTAAVGRIETGMLKTNMIVNFAPLNLTAEVKSIEMHHKSLQEALPGDIVGFNVKNVSVKELRRGFVCSDVQNNPAFETLSFIAQIIVINHPNQIKQGYIPVLHCHTASIPCQFAELLEKVDRRTGTTIEIAPKFIKSGDAAFVKMIPMKPICVEKFADYPLLGRFIIRDMKETIAVGLIKEITQNPVIL